MPGGAAHPGCADAAWPATLSDLPRRDTSPGDPAVAAWGDPAVVARCGVAALGPTASECIEVDGQGWVADPLTDGTRFVSFGTDPALEVLVPSRYDPAPLLLPAFTDIAQALPRNGLECR